MKLSNKHLLILILLLALTLRLVFFSGINFNDDLVYVNLAHTIVTNNFSPHPYIFATRLMMIYPMAFFFLFAITDFSASLYILLTSLGTVLLAYLIGKELFNERTGLIAGLLMAILPIEIIYATTIVPDVPMVFYLSLSAYFFIKGAKSDNKSLYFVSGLSLGLAWLVRSFAIIFVLFYLTNYLLDVIIRKKNFISSLKPYILLTAGLLLIFIIEGVIYKLSGHSFFTAFTVNQGIYNSSLLGINNDLSYYPRQLLNLSIIGKNFHLIGFYTYFALASLFMIIYKKRKEAYILLAWLIPIFLFMQYGSISITEYILMHKLYRYLTIITIPIVLLIAYSLTNFKFKRFEIAKPIILIFLLASSLFYTIKAYEYVYQSSLDVKSSAKFLSKLDDKLIYADEPTIGYLNFLLSYQYENKLRKLDDVGDIYEIKDSYVVVDSNRGYIELDEFKSKLPPGLGNPPEDWELLYIIKESTIGPYAAYDTKIYYAH